MTTLERILDLIKSKYGSDAAFERAAGLKPQSVNDWKRGKSQAFLKMIPRLAILLGTTSAYLLCETDDPRPPSTQKEPAIDYDDGLGADEKMLIDLFRSVPAESQGLVINLIEAALKNQGLL